MSDVVKNDEVPLLSEDAAEADAAAAEGSVEDDSTVVTMVDVLDQEEKLEEEMAAVLGGSDEKCCTHSKGYIKRQALYSCLTCCPEAKNDITKRAGICLACSYQCHEHHELIELYTKRDFRCDCPTERIPGKRCTFAGTAVDDAKFEPNSNNSYNQNFSGVYCTCKRPYPDADDPIQDEMIQCIMCEDWYHTRHLNAVVPTDSYSEMICGDCMNAYSFLRDYAGMAVNRIEPTAENGDVSVVVATEDDEKLKSELDKSISDIMPNITPDSSIEVQDPANSAEEEPAAAEVVSEKPAAAITTVAAAEEPAAKKPRIDDDDDVKLCKRPILGSNYKKGAVFWPDNWRKSLCPCPICTQMYENQKTSFLLDVEDTVLFYEENGLKKVRETDYERGIRALSTIGRSQQIDAITEYNRMKDKLKEYLHTFVVNQKVVTEEDINRFFQGMRNEKNTAGFGQPYFCR